LPHPSSLGKFHHRFSSRAKRDGLLKAANPWKTDRARAAAGLPTALFFCLSFFWPPLCLAMFHFAVTA
jgi:hypothetical protein